jgi:hypothetical protein
VKKRRKADPKARNKQAQRKKHFGKVAWFQDLLVDQTIHHIIGYIMKKRVLMPHVITSSTCIFYEEACMFHVRMRVLIFPSVATAILGE